MGDQHDVLELEQGRVHVGLVLEDVEAGALDDAVTQRLGQRALVHDGPAGRVDEVGVAAHLREALGRDQVVRLGRERAVQRDDIARAEQIVEAEERCSQLRLELLVRAAPPAVDDLHAECARPPCSGRADLTKADDAELLALQARAEHVVHVPAPLRAAADHALALAQPASDHEDQRHRDVGRRVREHAWRVRDQHAAGRTGSNVDVVVADGRVGDDAQLRAGGVEEGIVDLVVEERDDGVRACDRHVQLVDRQGRFLHVRVQLACLAQQLECRLGHAARDHDARRHQAAAVCASRSPIFCSASSMFSSEFAYETRR